MYLLELYKIIMNFHICREHRCAITKHQCSLLILFSEIEDAAKHRIYRNTKRLASRLLRRLQVCREPFIGYLSPEQFRWQPSLLLVSMAIVGGLSSLEGGIVGAV